MTHNPRAGKKLGRDEDDHPESVTRDIEDGYRCKHGVCIPEPCTQCRGGKATQLEGEQCSDPTVSSVIAPSVTATRDVPEFSNPVTQSVPTAIADAMVSRLAAKIAAQADTPHVGLTPEQEDILATSREVEAARGNGQRVLVIGAGAGTGKTFTLKQLEQVLSGSGQYTAFNSSLVAESKAKFKRAACNTTHSLAFRAIGRRYSHRLNGARVRSHEIASRLGIEDYYCELPESVQPKGEDGKPTVRRIAAGYLAGQITATIRRFCQSDRREISASDFRRFDGIDEKDSYVNSDKVRDYLLPFAKKAWADLSSETGNLMPFAHDVYVKLWQLGTGPDRPVIAADYILLDEAQDTAPVMLNVLKQQSHALLVLVGDDNQQIYEWRGAVNAMAAFRGAPRKLLSQSFRFGQSVADVANAVLAGLEESTDLVMRGLPSIPTRVCAVSSPRCYLFRTNAGAVSRLMLAREEGKRGHLIGGSEEVIKFCDAAVDLQSGRGTMHPELGCFQTWSEVQAYSKEDEGADLRLMVKLIDEFGAEEIRDALRDMPPEDKADLVLSTAHRSKGREWSSVRLGADFPLANKLSDADRRLVYVAATRAQEELDITVCPTFCGGYDRREDGEAEAEWIPGILIEYTAPMPTAEALAEYRATKGAKMPAVASNALTPTTAPAAAPTAPAPIPAPANGSGATGEFTWGNVDGQWCVRGPKGRQTGERVTVVRKNGTRSQVTLGAVTRKIGDLWFYAI